MAMMSLDFASKYRQATWLASHSLCMHGQPALLFSLNQRYQNGGIISTCTSTTSKTQEILCGNLSRPLRVPVSEPTKPGRSAKWWVTREVRMVDSKKHW